MAKGYRFLEHTADVEYIAYGKDERECFSNALMAMFDTASYLAKLERSKEKRIIMKVKSRASRTEDLLWYLLQDVLSMTDAKGLFAYSVKRLRIGESGTKRTAEAELLARERSDQASKLDVKGVSRYELSLRRTGRRLEAHVVLDV